MIVIVLPRTVYSGTVVVVLGITGTALVVFVAPAVLPAVALVAPICGVTVPR